MKTFVLTSEDNLIGEAVEFSNGHVVVRWLAGDIVSRFVDVATLHTNMPDTVTFGPEPREPLGQRLRGARTAAGLSQRGLSRQIGVSFSTISRIEAGHSYISNPVLEEWLEGR